MNIKLKITTTENASFLNCDINNIIEIDFEDYVATVTASEIGEATIEACKAQAIAARTFAVSRGVLNGKVISDSSSTAQACRLVRSRYTNCVAATNATKGQVLTYNGSTINAVYCNSNGGHTYSSKEVWGGDRPYLINQDDPWTRAIGAKKSGHGVGLSQKGTIYAGKNNVSYDKILAFYYPGTKITKNYNQTEEELDYNKIVLEEIKVRVQQAIEILKEGL